MNNYAAYKGISNATKAVCKAPLAFVLLCWIGLAHGYTLIEKSDEQQWSKKQCQTAAYFQIPTIGFCRINGSEAQNPKPIVVPEAYR